jgi:NAD(P)-dependent dehydrogenase (short-subunit alcohol dehydrogenase family)
MSEQRKTPTRSWFVTGGSRGFGRLWTEAALERGDRVAATARDATTLRPLGDRFGASFLPLELDVTNRDAVFACVRAAVDRFGSLDVVVNNAGYGHFGAVEELTEAEVREQMDTNFFGALWVTQAALPTMRAQRSGQLLQVTSEGGVLAFPGIGAYHASKWALEGLSESLAQEVAEHGIRVTCVEPGPYRTGWLDVGARHSPPNPAYRGLHDRAAAFETGDPEATKAAILRIVDTDDPPLRVLLGRGYEAVRGAYERRLAEWDRWQDVALDAFGAA